MGDEDYRNLKDSILQTHNENAGLDGGGFREPLWTWQGKLIDGRNRRRVTIDLKLDRVSVCEWDGKGSLVQLGLAKNLARRHMIASQEGMLAADIEPRLADEAKERQRSAGGDHGNQHTGGKGWVVANLPQPPDSGRAREAAARIVGASPRYVQQAKRIKEADPDLSEQVRNGKVKIPQASKIVHEKVQKEIRRQANLQAIQSGASVDEITLEREKVAAWHEAAHAAVAYVLGAAIGEITIKGSVKYGALRGGCCQFTFPVSKSFGAAENSIMVNPAGEIAERLYCEGTPREARYHGSSDAYSSGRERESIDRGCNITQDWCDFGNGRFWSDGTAQLHTRYLRSLVEDILKAPVVRGAMVALVTELLAHKTIDGDTATKVLGERLKVWGLAYDPHRFPSLARLPCGRHRQPARRRRLRGADEWHGVALRRHPQMVRSGRPARADAVAAGHPRAAGPGNGAVGAAGGLCHAVEFRGAADQSGGV
jgi:hypothetical protein